MKGKVNLIFSRGDGRVQTKQPFMGEVWILFGTHGTYLITLLVFVT